VGAFGEKLRKQREQRGLALDAISNSTKISTRMLRALEDEHFDQLPGGVFNKGFVRAYARQVGLDEEETITDYLAALRESQVQSQKILPDFRSPGVKPSPIVPPGPQHPVPPASNLPAAESKNNGSPDPRTPDRRKHDRRNEARRNQLPTKQGRDLRNEAPLDEVGRDHDSRASGRSVDRPQQENQVGPRRNEDRPHRGSSSLPGFITGPAAEDSIESVDAPAPRFSRIMLAATLLLLTVGLAIWNSHRHRASVSKAPAPSSSSPSSPGGQSPAPTPTSTAASPKTASASAASTPSAGKSSASVPSPTKSSTTGLSPKPAANPSAANSSDTDTDTDTITHTRAPATKPLSTFTLLIRADQTTWISIAADGKPAAHETLIAPAHTSVRATREVVVKAGNAAGVSFLLNGKEFPPQGNVGEVRSYVFDATGLRSVPQTQTPTPNR